MENKTLSVEEREQLVIALQNECDNIRVELNAHNTQLNDDKSLIAKARDEIESIEATAQAIIDADQLAVPKQDKYSSADKRKACMISIAKTYPSYDKDVEIVNLKPSEISKTERTISELLLLHNDLVDKIRFHVAMILATAKASSTVINNYYR